jgi:copper(I)-binding protein|tara:strand:+ start:7615 stop:8046 length:432 start_codon:yes stop_codon:yes gene_type:complete
MERVMKYLVVALIMICSSVWAEDYKLGDLTVMESFSYPTNGRSGAGYFTLTNDGPVDVLMAVTADFPRVMIHESLMQDGVMTMQHRMMVEVPERGEIEFGPGGYHVMFMGLDEGWAEGDEIEASLQFKNAGTLNIKFVVIMRP